MQFARDAAPFFVLRLEQSGSQFAQALVGGVEFDGALANALLEIVLGFTQRFVFPATPFRDSDDSACG